MKPSLIFYYKLSALFFLLISFSTPSYATNEAIKFTAQEIRQLTGHYSTSYGYFYIQSKKGIVTTVANGRRVYLQKREDGLIYPVYKLLGFIPFSKDNMAFSIKQARGKQLVMLHAVEKGKKVQHEVGEKFIPKPISAKWRQRLGRYKITFKNNKKITIKTQLTIKNGVLLGMLGDDTLYPFLPRSDNSAIIPGSGEGHLVELLAQKDKLYLRQRNNTSQLIKQ